METKIVINVTTILFTVFSIFMSVLGYFIVRTVKGYDKQIQELFERTKDIPAIREAIEWIKTELKK